MATDLKISSEDAEMADCDGEKVVTMMDVLQEQEDFEDDANAVLGASDEKNCTYSKGYIKRQAIYACMTCCSEAKDDPRKRAGVCLACSLTCHESHDLIELYTKRNFKCDCGNPKFNSHPCQFTPDKTDINEENNYNQNFSGIYCVCERPYPDPESPTDVEMIQCVICEDWLHTTHLEATVPDSDQYSEMICKGCMEKNEFLHDYSNLTVKIDVDVVTNGIDINKINKDNVNEEATRQDSTIANNEPNQSTIEKKADENSENKPIVTEKEKGVPIDKAIKELTDKDNLNDANKDLQNESEPNSDHTHIEQAIEAENSNKMPEELKENRLLADPDHDTKIPADVISNVQSTASTEKNLNIESMNTEPLTDENEATKDSASKIDIEQIDTNKIFGAIETDPIKDGSNSTAEEKIEAEEINVTENIAQESKSGELNGETEQINNKIVEKRKLSTEEDTSVKKQKQHEACMRPSGVSKTHKGATFWPANFRQNLCTCTVCISMYKGLSILYLTDPEDTVTAYENLGKQKINGKPATQYEKGLQALSSLDRIQQINALTEYNKMRDKLLEFLKSFKDRREVVKEEDIKAFFAEMKPKREPDGVYFCR